MNSITNNTSVREAWKKIQTLKDCSHPTIIRYLQTEQSIVTMSFDIVTTLSEQFAKVSATNYYYLSSPTN